MQDLSWSREAQAQRVRNRIWQYLSPAAVPTDAVLPLASALMGLPGRDVQLLRSLHLLLSPQVAALASAAPGLLRHLRTSTVAVLEQHPERVRGPVDWPATLAASAAQGRRYAYATRPPERDYSTPENRLLVASLGVVAQAARSLAWQPARQGVASQVAHIGDTALALLGSPVLRRVVPAAEARDPHRVEHGRAARRFAPVTHMWRLHERLQVAQDPALLREMVESTALLASSDGALLEVLVLIEVLEALSEHGWRRERFGLVQGKARLRHRRHGDVLDVYYQSAPPNLPSRYTRVLEAHGVRASPLRPDLVLDLQPSGGPRVLTVVEVKYRGRAAEAVREALFDLLAYRDAYQGVPAQLRLAGVAWGHGLSPVTEADVLLCTVDRIAELVSVLYG